jgi:hypothetical protein
MVATSAVKSSSPQNPVVVFLKPQLAVSGRPGGLSVTVKAQAPVKNVAIA